MYNAITRVQFKINTQVLKLKPVHSRRVVYRFLCELICDSLCQKGCQFSSATLGMSLGFIDAISVAWSEHAGKLAVLTQSGGFEFNLHRIHDNSSVPLWVYMSFPVPQHQNETNKNVYRQHQSAVQINTHGCENWHLCISDGSSVVQCSLLHAIGIVFIDTIPVAWSDRAGQLAAGGFASVW